MLIWMIDDKGDSNDWTVEGMLEEINRDRNEEWIPYDASDYLEGWDEFVEGEFYTRHDPQEEVTMPDNKQSPLAGKTVKVRDNVKYIGGETYHVEDYWQNIAGKSWMYCEGNPACLDYAARSSKAGLPFDNDVLYGKIGAFGKLVHVSEIDDIEPTR